MIKSEVMSLDLTNANITPDKLQQIKDTLWKIKGGNIKAEIVETGAVETPVKSKNKAIKDDEIVDLNSELKQEELNVEDLLWDDLNKLD
jgi:hypothetical protein